MDDDIKKDDDDIDINTLLKEIQEDIGESDPNKKKETTTTTPGSSSLNLFKSNKVIPSDIIDDPETENRKNYNFLNISESKRIEDDIKKMKLELKKSEEFFAAARDSLEAINFENIKHRIKDLHLYPNDDEVSEIFQNLEQKKNFNEQMAKLTSIVTDKFKKHPGEFADIPEMSSFFKVCSQLKNGLDDLEKKKTNFNTLGKRIIWATNVSENRSRDIQNILHEQRKLVKSLQHDGGTDKLYLENYEE